MLPKPYSLTLTADERKAFDFAGHRYATGDEVRNILCDHLEGDEAWDDYGDITFALPEHAAWEIADLAENEENRWPLFGDELTKKMMTFIRSIV